MRLEIMRRSDIALRAIRLLHADDGQTLRAAEIADRLGSTPQFIPQVLAPLIRAGWITSEPGPRGGYRLAGEPASHSMLELIEVMEGPTDNGTCVLRGGPCEQGTRCSLHDAWFSARDALMARLAQEPLWSPTPTEQPHRKTKS